MVANLATLPPAATGYEGDHSRLLMRYMFLMSPDEQRQLLASGPATTAAPTTQHHASAKRKRRGLNHVRSLRRAALGRKMAWAVRS